MPPAFFFAIIIVRRKRNEKENACSNPIGDHGSSSACWLWRGSRRSRCDGGSGCNRSLAGEIMMRFAAKKGLAGIVVDGCLRDWDGIQNLEMPIYAKGVTPQGPFKFGPGEVNTPIACGGQVVFPGDILVGDLDGIVVIRRQDAEAVAEVAQKKKASEDKTFELMEADLNAYAAKHLATTAKRFEGRNPEFVDEAYTSVYKL